MVILSAIATLLLSVALFSCNVDGQGMPMMNGCDEFYDIAIVGGGSAGAYSAYRLRNERKKIGLFEYSAEIGGRALDKHLKTAPDVNIQMGEFRFGENRHVKVNKLSQELGLQKIVFESAMGGKADITRFFLRGFSLSSAEVYSGRVPYAMTDEESNNRHRLLEFYFEKLTGYNADNILTDNLKPEDIFSFKLVDGTGRYLYQISMEEALNLVASSEGKSFFEDTSQFYGVFEKDTSAVAEFMYLFLGNFGDVATLKEGMQALPRALVDKFLEASTTHHFLWKSKQLTSIYKTNENIYKLSFKPTEYNTRRQVTEVLEFEKDMKVCARQVILALPMFALKQIDWQPLRSGKVAETLGSYTFPTACKVYMTFPTAWWLDAPKRRLQVNIGDRKSSFRQMYDWKKSDKTGEYVLMASYTDGHKAQYLKYLQNKEGLAKGSEKGVYRVSEELKDKLLGDLADAMDIKPNSIPDPTGLIAKFWADYPYGSLWVEQKAGYSFDDSVQVLRKPSMTDDVFLVGPDYAWGNERYWIEGGLNTVDTVIEKYFKNFQHV